MEPDISTSRFQALLAGHVDGAHSTRECSLQEAVRYCLDDVIRELHVITNIRQQTQCSDLKGIYEVMCLVRLERTTEARSSTTMQEEKFIMTIPWAASPKDDDLHDGGSRPLASLKTSRPLAVCCDLHVKTA